MANRMEVGMHRPAWLMVMVLALCPACDSDGTGPAPTPARVDMVQVSPAASVLEVGATRQYSARAFAADGAELFGRPAAWSVSSDAVTVSETGLVTAVEPGYADVIATMEGVAAAVGVTVMPLEAPSDPVAYVIVAPGETAVFDTGTGRYSQSFTVETRLLGSAPDAAILRSTTRPGTELRGQWLGAGEIVLPQSLLGTPSRPWVWALQ